MPQWNQDETQEVIHDGMDLLVNKEQLMSGTLEGSPITNICFFVCGNFPFTNPISRSARPG
jgi:hypothetical protein